MREGEQKIFSSFYEMFFMLISRLWLAFQPEKSNFTGSFIELKSGTEMSPKNDHPLINPSKCNIAINPEASGF